MKTIDAIQSKLSFFFLIYFLPFFLDCAKERVLLADFVSPSVQVRIGYDSFRLEKVTDIYRLSVP